MTLSRGAVGVLANTAYHRQSVALSMPAARISCARLTPRASTARAAGALHSARLITSGLVLGLGLPGRFSALVHGDHLVSVAAYESIRSSRSVS